MNKEQIANNINATISEISRQIKVSDFIDFEIGQIIEAKNAESWTNGGVFKVENDDKVTYVFVCENEVSVHIVDYENEDETWELGCENCEEEKEVLVPAATKFEIIDLGNEDDLEEMGFITVNVKHIKER